MENWIPHTTAAHDGARKPDEKLTDYYARSGDLPGVWMGSGSVQMGVSGEVSEDQLSNLRGLGLHPVTGGQLGSRTRIYATVDERVTARLARLNAPTPAQVQAIQAAEERKGERQAVASFDRTFSPVKSISVAWGLATPGVAEQIMEAHWHAAATTISMLENEVARLRDSRRFNDWPAPPVQLDSLVRWRTKSIHSNRTGTL